MLDYYVLGMEDTPTTRSFYGIKADPGPMSPDRVTEILDLEVWERIPPYEKYVAIPLEHHVKGHASCVYLCVTRLFRKESAGTSGSVTCWCLATDNDIYRVSQDPNLIGSHIPLFLPWKVIRPRI